MPFRALSDFLTGANDVRRMGEQAKQAARAQYDPSILSPQLSVFQQMATEGIEDEASIARRGAIEQFFRPVDVGMTGGNQGRGLAIQQQQNEASMRGLANLESSLAQADIQARQQGRQGFAETRTQQNQLEAQRRAAIETADLQTQAEIDRRKSALGSTIGSLAGTVAGSFLGPLGAAAGGALGGGLLGGGQGALTGAATGATTALQQQNLEGDTEQVTSDETVPTTDLGGLAQFLSADFSGSDVEQPSEGIGLQALLDLDLQQFLDTDLSEAEPDLRTEQEVQRNIMGDMGAQYQVPQLLERPSPAQDLFSRMQQGNRNVLDTFNDSPQREIDLFSEYFLTPNNTNLFDMLGSQENINTLIKRGSIY